jgi:hypothetical protein
VDSLFGLFFLAVGVFVGLILLLSFETTRKWAGLGSVQPTGVPGYLSGLMHPAAAASS